MEIVLHPVAYVHSTRQAAIDDHWDQETVFIELTEAYGPDSLKALDSFSHVAVVFHMHQVTKVTTGARHPRNRADWPEVGVFAQRGKNRPNALGLTVCRIVKLESTRLYVEGLDAIDGTPVLDLKPWVATMGPRGAIVEPHWMQVLMADYWA